MIFKSLNIIDIILIPANSKLAQKRLITLLMITLSWLLVINGLSGQAVGDFRTNGNVTFNNNSNWQSWNGAWVAAAAPPVLGSNVITIRSGHTATLTASKTLDQLVVEAGGTLLINPGQTLTLFNYPTGIDLDVSGTVGNSGTITINPGATINFQANSIYNHTRNGGTIPTATWDPASDCIITGITNSTSLTGFGQTFGNLIWNCPGQTSNFYISSDLNIEGDFIVSGTGSFDSNNHVLRMSNSGTGYTITVKGDFSLENSSSFKMNNSTGSCTMNVDGNFRINNGCYFTIVTGNASSTLSVKGNFNISGGTLNMQEESSMIGRLNVGGNFTLEGGGIITETSTGSGIINFNGNTTQIYSKTGGTFSNLINFSVSTGAILDVGTSLIDGSSGTFTLNSGAGIITAHTQGFSLSPGIGSIQVAGTRTFNTSADYTYNGLVAQVTGDALPNTVRNLTVNNSAGVVLTNSVTVSNLLTLTMGKLSLGNLNLAIPFGGSVNGGSSLSYIIAEGSGTLKQYVSSANKLFPVGTTASYNPVTLNNSGSADNFSVNLFPSVTDNGLSSGLPVSYLQECVSMTWRVREDVSGGSNLSVITQWNAADEGSSFTRADCSVGYHNGSDWTPDPGGSSPASGPPYTQTRSGILGVGSFAVGNKCTKLGDSQVPLLTTVAGTLDRVLECSNVTGLTDALTLVPTATDNCTAVPVIHLVSDTSTPDATCPNAYVRVRIWNFTDNWGNTSANFVQTITIDDTTAPVITGTITAPVI